MFLPKRYASAQITWTGIFCFLVLLLFASHFYLERIAYLDLAMHVFDFLINDKLFIQNKRFVAAATQIWPLLGFRTGLPLDAVLRLYSLAFVGYYFAVFLISAYLFRNEHVALAVPLLFTLLISNTFYWAQSEFPQALAALLLYYAGVSKLAPLPYNWRTLLLLLLIPVGIYGHPLLLLPFTFLWGYDYLLNRRFTDWLYYLTLLIAVFCYWLRNHDIAATSYEGQRMNLWENLVQFYPNYFTLAGNTELLQLCQTRYYMFPVLLIVITSYYAWRRPAGWGARLAWIWAFTIGYAEVVVITHPEHTDITYLENLYLPLGLCVAIPLTMEVLPSFRWPRLAVGLLLVVFGLRLIAIWQAHVPYSRYTHWLDSTLAYTRQFPEQKFIIDQANLDPQHQRIVSWASPYESLLLSARHSPDSTRQLFVTNDVPALVGSAIPQDAVATPWGPPLSYRALPWQYMRPQPSSYRTLNTPPPADTAALATYMQERRDTQLKFVAISAPLRANKLRLLTLRITPPAAKVLHSGLHTPYPTVFTYRYFSSENWPQAAEVLTTPLEIDVEKEWTQDVPIIGPHEPGNYVLEVVLTSQNYHDWPVKLRIPIEAKP
ncbi:hypothetical protein [Hymenobacter sp. GOD-10R]|uniref:hypothetical protein n=1 Tax=Hymenobacter sp. GOD-10R TaxID=3093922 RepID=UPI002D77273A|nr:hypothetical protein [Hymenobacter sp. GOD-10R]WRQ28307.1 hypothetical protein SD425_24880 [Hymenobacter sp. GOD-10R]